MSPLPCTRGSGAHSTYAIKPSAGMGPHIQSLSYSGGQLDLNGWRTIATAVTPLSGSQRRSMHVLMRLLAYPLGKACTPHLCAQPRYNMAMAALKRKSSSRTWRHNLSGCMPSDV